MKQPRVSFSRRSAHILPANEQTFQQAAAQLRRGGLVAFPTETVYGLGANALNASAVREIFHAKRRPRSDPLIVHIDQPETVHDLFAFESDLAKKVFYTLIQSFWPGPLTIIHKALASVPSEVTAGSGYVGVRCPRHPIARQLIATAGCPVAAPSANRFGHVSPTTAQHVYDDLHHVDDLIILTDNNQQAGQMDCQVGIESTVCRLSQEGDLVEILRCGAVTSGQLERVLAALPHPPRVLLNNHKNIIKHSPDTPDEAVTVTDSKEAIQALSPGQMIRHYAPDLPTYIVSGGQRDDQNLQMLRSDADLLASAVVIDFGGILRNLQGKTRHYSDLSSSGSAKEACSCIFARLREAESMQSQGIRCVLLPDLRLLLSDPACNALGQGAKDDDEYDDIELLRALWERLLRAASGNFLASAWQ
eukprot:gene11079-12338_t